MTINEARAIESQLRLGGTPEGWSRSNWTGEAHWLQQTLQAGRAIGKCGQEFFTDWPARAIVSLCDHCIRYLYEVAREDEDAL